LTCQLRQNVAPFSILGGKAYVLPGGDIFFRKVDTLPILRPYFLKSSLKAPFQRRSGSTTCFAFSFVARPAGAPEAPPLGLHFRGLLPLAQPSTWGGYSDDSIVYIGYCCRVPQSQAGGHFRTPCGPRRSSTHYSVAGRSAPSGCGLVGPVETLRMSLPGAGNCHTGRLTQF
jgi:hypothetical protein